MNKISFEALIKKIEIKSLVSCDRGGRLFLEFMADEQTIAGLNKIMKADKTVMVAIVEIK